MDHEKSQKPMNDNGAFDFFIGTTDSPAEADKNEHPAIHRI